MICLQLYRIIQACSYQYCMAIIAFDVARNECFEIFEDLTGVILWGALVYFWTPSRLLPIGSLSFIPPDHNGAACEGHPVPPKLEKQ